MQLALTRWHIPYSTPKHMRFAGKPMQMCIFTTENWRVYHILLMQSKYERFKEFYYLENRMGGYSFEYLVVCLIRYERSRMAIKLSLQSETVTQAVTEIK